MDSETAWLWCCADCIASHHLGAGAQKMSVHITLRIMNKCHNDAHVQLKWSDGDLLDIYIHTKVYRNRGTQNDSAQLYLVTIFQPSSAIKTHTDLFRFLALGNICALNNR